MKLRIVIVLLGLTLVAATSARPAGAAKADESKVAEWIEVTLGEVSSSRLNPPRASRGLALVSAAMHDAAFAAAPQEGSAVAGAASTVLGYLFPDDAEQFEQRGRAAARNPHAFAIGQRIGETYVARGESDGLDARWSGERPVGRCVWIPTPPGLIYPPLEPTAGTWLPWHLSSGSQFRPALPPACGSKAYKAAMREVQKVSQALTAEQKRIAAFWADGPGSVTPPGHWNLIALELVRRDGLSTLASASVFATLNTAQADAFIGCWDSKYAYWLERPVTAIRREIDPDWMSYIVTPPFPAYTSGHASTSGAASEVLAHFFPADSPQLRAWAEEAALSRLYGGIHFRFDNDQGLALGRKIAGVAITSRFASG
jgi:hypothetical protein